MTKSTNRLIVRSIGAVLIAVSIGVIVRLAIQFNSIERHPCGSERGLVFNYTESEIHVQGISLQEDGSVQNVEVVLAPNQSSEEAGVCSVHEMTVRGAKDWFHKGMKMRPGVWMVISTKYTYCISGEEPITGEWYEVLCSKELANTE